MTRPGPSVKIASFRRRANRFDQSRCEGDYGAVLETVRQIGDSLWADEVKLMGPPVPDKGTAGDGDDRIDVYVVDVGAAPTTAPYVDNRSSAYLLMGRAGPANRLEFKLTFAHEFFHVLQDAHNRAINFRWSGDFDAEGNQVWDDWWFTEASATWAEVYFVPEGSPTIHMDRFVRGFRDETEVSLHASQPPEHTYHAYVWPFFMEQEGGPKATRTTAA